MFALRGIQLEEGVSHPANQTRKGETRLNKVKIREMNRLQHCVDTWGTGVGDGESLTVEIARKVARTSSIIYC